MISLIAAMALAGAVLTPAEQVKWTQVEPEIWFAPLWGDPGQGAYGALAKFKVGHKLGKHTHTAEMKVTVVSGTMYYALENEAEKKLPPGSYALIPANLVHTHRCEAPAECIIMMQQPDKLDAKVVGR